MKNRIILPLILIEFLTCSAYANCNSCTKTQTYIQNFLSKKIKCEPLNNATAEQQEQFVLGAAKLANQLLNEAKFGLEQAKSFLLLTSTIAPYDVAMLFIQDVEISYRKKIIIEAANVLEKEKKFSHDLKEQVLEYLGLIPSKDRLKDIVCPVQ